MRRRSEPATDRPARVLGYVRVSGREQATDGTSLDGQRERIERWCSERGYPAPEIRVEVESASEEKLERRVALGRLVEEARPGDVVVVALLDRWSRDIVYGVGSIRKLVRSGVGYHAIHEQIDASTPHGDEQLGLRMWFAESERRRIRDRTVGRREELRAQGLWATGTVPFGYRRGDRAQRRHLYLEADPERAPIVREWWERAAGGESMATLAAWLQTIPGAPRHAAQIHRIMKGRIYLGEIRVNGLWLAAAHPPLITPELWERAREAIAGRRQQGRMPRGETSAHLLLRGIVRCGICGRRASVCFVKRHAYLYYVCGKRRHRGREGDCAGPYLRAEPLDDAATADVLARIRSLGEELEQLDVGPSPAPAGPDLAEARRRVETALSRAVQLAVEGTITAAELGAQRERLAVQRRELDRRAAAQEAEERARTPEARASVAAALEHLERTWAHLTVEERREAVRLLAARVEITAEGTLRWIWRGIPELVGGSPIRPP
jgi:site-specific DNA recombinase